MSHDRRQRAQWMTQRRGEDDVPPMRGQQRRSQRMDVRHETQLVLGQDQRFGFPREWIRSEVALVVPIRKEHGPHRRRVGDGVRDVFADAPVAPLQCAPRRMVGHSQWICWGIGALIPLCIGFPDRQLNSVRPSVVNAMQVRHEHTQGAVAEDHIPEQVFRDSRQELHVTMVVEHELLEVLSRFAIRWYYGAVGLERILHGIHALGMTRGPDAAEEHGDVAHVSPKSGFQELPWQVLVEDPHRSDHALGSRMRVRLHGLRSQVAVEILRYSMIHQPRMSFEVARSQTEIPALKVADLCGVVVPLVPERGLHR